MADKKDDAKAKAGDSGSGAPAAKAGVAKLAIVAVVAVLVAVGAAAGVYMFVLAPRLQPAEAPATHGAEAHGDEAATEEHGEEEHGESMAEAAAVEFEEESVNVLPDGAGGKVALLTYKCALVVPNAEMSALVGDKARKPFFSSIMLRLHSNRTKTELNDPRVKESILRQAKQECNAMMKKLFPENEHAKVLDVMHIKYTLFEI